MNSSDPFREWLLSLPRNSFKNFKVGDKVKFYKHTLSGTSSQIASNNADKHTDEFEGEIVSIKDKYVVKFILKNDWHEEEFDVSDIFPIKG